MKKKVLILLILTVSTCSLYSQWTISDSPDDTVGIIGDHGYKSYFKNLFEVEGINCGIDEYFSLDSTVVKYFLRDDRSDIVFIEVFDLRGQLNLSGFYKLVYVHDKNANYLLNSGLPLCWRKDMIWCYYDSDGNLLKQEFYNEGKIVQPKVFQLRE